MRTVWFCVIGLFFAGCIPMMHGPYYKPSYPDPSAEEVLASCYGQVGPPSGVKFTIPEGIEVSFSTVKPYGSKRNDYPFSVRLIIPPGVKVQFLSNEIAVSAPGGETVRGPEQIRVVSTGLAEVQTLLDAEAMCPVPVDAMVQSAQRPFVVISYWGGREGGQFASAPSELGVFLPDLTVGDVPLKIAPIIMEGQKIRSDTYYLTARMREERQQRYRLCVEKTPERACKNFLEVYDTGYRETTDDFNLSVSASHGGGQTGFRADLEARTPKPWRLSTDKVVMQDMKSGVQVQRTIGSLSVHCGSFYVPVMTPVHGPETLEPGRSNIFIEGSLGESLHSDMTIQLPPLKINETLYRFEPIRLELRLFDGGIYPFNC